MTRRDRRHHSQGPSVVAVLTIGLLQGCVGDVLDSAHSQSHRPRNPDDPGGSPQVPPGGVGLAPPPPGSGEQPCTPTVATPARLWRLSDDQFAHAIADLLPGVVAPEISTPGRSKAEFV